MLLLCEMDEIIITISLLITALPLFIYGIWGLMRDKHIKNKGVETDAKITFVCGNLTLPIVEYQTTSGLIRKRSWYATSLAKKYRVNEITLRIRYDSEHPKHFLVMDYHTNTIIYVIFIMAGIFNLIMAVVIPLLLL